MSNRRLPASRMQLRLHQREALEGIRRIGPAGDAIGAFTQGQMVLYANGLLRPKPSALLESIPGWTWARRREVYPEFDQQALNELALAWFKASRDVTLAPDIKHERKCEIALRCRALLPGFRYARWKQRGRSTTP